MIRSLLIAIVPPMAIAVLLLRLAWQPKAGFHTCLLQIVLASGLSFGISSCLFFLWLARPFSIGLPFSAAEPILLLGAVASLLMSGKARRFMLVGGSDCSWTLSDADVADTDRTRKGLIISVYLVLSAATAALVLVLINKPHGGIDSYAIWNLHARFLFRGHEQWAKGFSVVSGLSQPDYPLLSRPDYWLLSHPDYPLLIPASIARLWTHLGFETVKVPQFIAAFFTMGTIAVLLSSLAILRSKTQGLVAALFLMATAPFIMRGADQYADIPIGFFILVTVALLALQDTTSGGRRGLISLAGMTAGFAAWTKNEGFLFLPAVIVSRSFVLLLRRDYRRYFKELGSFLVGLLPVLAVVLYFKLKYAPPNDLFGSHNFQRLVEMLGDAHRYVVIAKAFGREFLHWGNGLMAVFLVYLVTSGIGLNRRNQTAFFTGIIMLAFMVAGYFFTYLITPLPLTFHLSTSLERVFLQLWPTFLLVAFFIVTPLGGQLRA